MAPILPGISDRPEQLAAVVRAARAAGATGIWANLLNLRPGTREHSSKPRPRLARAARAVRAALCERACLSARRRPCRCAAVAELAREPGSGTGGRLRLGRSPSPSARARPSHFAGYDSPDAQRDHLPDRRRPRGRPRRAAPLALPLAPHPRDRRGRRRRERGRARGAAQAERRDHGRPHARAWTGSRRRRADREGPRRRS